jgi:hypothetical protein
MSEEEQRIAGDIIRLAASEVDEPLDSKMTAIAWGELTNI